MSDVSEAKPLAGRTVLIARDPDRAASLRVRLELLGAQVVVSPVTAVEAGDSDALDAAVGKLAEFAWVVVASVNAVAALGRAARRLGVALADVSVAAPGMARTRWAAVGPASSAALARLGVAVELEPATRSAAGLVAAFAEISKVNCALFARSRGKNAQSISVPDAPRALLPLGDMAAPTLADGLRELGYDVETVVAYRTVQAVVPDAIKGMWGNSIDAVVMAAGSAVRQVAAQLGPNERVAVVAIGEATAAVVRECGFHVDAVASAATDEAVAEAMVGAVGH